MDNDTTLGNMKISSRLVLGFGLLISLTLVMGALSYLNISNLSGLLTEFSEHPFRVTDQTQQLESNILAMDRDLAELVNGTQVKMISAHIDKIRRHNEAARDNLKIISQYYLGPRGDVAKLKQDLARLQERQAQVISLKQKGSDAESISLRDSGATIEQQTERDIQVILNFAHAKAASLLEESSQEQKHAIHIIIFTLIGLLLVGLLSARLISRSITRPMDSLQQTMQELSEGNLEVAIPYLGGQGEFSTIAETLNAFKLSAAKLESQRWIKTTTSELSNAMQLSESKQAFADTLINRLTPLCNGGVGIFYLANEAGDAFELLGSYGLKKRRSLNTSFKLGESLVGQAALERKSIILTDVPDDYARITTGIGEAAPTQILVAPIVSKAGVLAVIEIGTFQAMSQEIEAMIDELLPIIALNLEIIERNLRTQELLTRTQQQAEELRASEEELRAQSEQLQSSNEELKRKGINLQEQAEELRASEEELRTQREELQAANEELEEKSSNLEEQARLLEKARSEAEHRALERDTANRYKSEFLSNMSHELRTPLNSLLILARSLRDNKDGNLTEDQVDSANIILESGTTLLRLLNDILDLSKVEAGKMEIDARDISLQMLASSLEKRFKLMAENKGLTLDVDIDPDLPAMMRSDPGKVDQILNNLIGNAIKFTEKGGIDVHIGHPEPSPWLEATKLSGEKAVQIKVVDSGIGIPEDRLESVFNAFEQVDGSTSRLYGGTGLGLTISRRLAEFLGGNIHATSRKGEGSTFILLLPLQAEEQPALKKREKNEVAKRTASDTNAERQVTPAAVTPHFIDDDRQTVSPKDETILIIEDDEAFARIVRDLSRKRGFKALVAGDGVSGLELAKSYLPTGIVLDIGLPGMDGWGIMETLKQSSDTRHIPVHFISATDSSLRGLEMGAVGYLTKPVNKEQIEGVFERIRHFGTTSPRRLLLVEDDAGTRKSVNVMLKDIEVEIIEEKSGEGALERLRQGEDFDCMILDLSLPGISGLELLEQCTREELIIPPVVVYSGRTLSDEDAMALKEYTDSIVIKGARSPERLLDEVTLFLHSVHSKLPPERTAARSATEKESIDDLAEHTVLIVDDDMRNAFALSKVLRGKGLKVLVAQDGNKALSQINDAPGIDFVLMDIMMPGMDGYAAIREIRKQERFATLPIIALTAKAMLGDREKCIEAGASDYLSKPVDIDALITIMRGYLAGDEQ